MLTHGFSKLDQLFVADQIMLLFSQMLLDEFVEVARRPKFKKYFSLTDLEELLFQVQAKAEFVTVASTVGLCRDPKDNFLLALAQHGKVTHLLTGDKDLLVLGRLGKTKIISIFNYIIN